MARTIRNENPRPYAKESKEQRKAQAQAVRRSARQMFGIIDHEAELLPVVRKTGGWLTH